MALGDPREQFSGQDPRRGLRMDVDRSSGRGVVHATPQTGFMPEDNMPAYLRGLVEPYIKRKQTEAFYNGYMAQQAAGAEVEVIDDGGIIADIWGPDGYREGASFYRGNALVSNRVRSYLEDVDNLKQLPPEELSRKLAEDSETLQTGNATTDGIVQKQLVEQMGPTINTILKARYEWQQNNGVEAQVEAIASQGSLMQRLYVDQSRTTVPDQDLTDAIAIGENQFLGTIGIPHGQTSASYKRALGLSSRRLLREGNFYAFEALKEKGLLDLMDEKDAAAIEKSYMQDGGRAVEEARKTLMPEIIALRARIKFENLSPMAAAQEFTKLNEKARKVTGVRGIDLFDAKAIESGATDVIELTRQTALRNQARLEAIEDREAQWAHEEAVRQREIAEDIATANTVWAAGTVNTGIARKDVDSGQMEALAVRAYNSGAVAELVGPFTREGWTSSRAKEMIQSGIASSIPEGWTDVTAKTYDKWKTLYEANGGAAAAYFGTYHTPMLAMHSMMQGSEGMTPALAWTRAFGNNAMLDAHKLTPEDRKITREAIKVEADRINGGFMGIGDKDLSESARSVISQSIEGYVAMNRKFSTVDVKTLVRQAYDLEISNGTLENYGKHAWRNPKGTTPLWQLSNIQPDAFPKVLDKEITERLRASGWTAPLRQYEVARQGSSLIVMAFDGDGGSKTIRLTVKDLQNRKGAEIARRRSPTAGMQPGATPGTGLVGH